VIPGPTPPPHTLLPLTTQSCDPNPCVYSVASRATPATVILSPAASIKPVIVELSAATHLSS